MFARCLLLAVACVALAACTRTAQTTGGRHSWTQPGVLRIANLSEPDTLDPAVGNEQIEIDLSWLWGAYLTTYDADGNLVPELATRVPSAANGDLSADGRRVVYHLRPGVEWHDGAPFTAADVVFSLHAVLDPKNNVATRTGFDRVDRIVARDPQTVEVDLKRPYAPFLSTFFSLASASAIPLLPKHLLGSLPDINRAAYNAKPVGTGPFVVREWHRGSAIVFDANPSYWRGAPKLRQIVYHPIPDENTILTQLRTHEIDLYYNAPAEQVATLRSLPDVKTLLTPFAEYALLGINENSPELSDVRVRQALVYALDRERIAADVTHGVGTVSPAVADQPGSSWARATGLSPYGYDPARARSLLDAAGWHVGPDGIRTKGGRRLSIVMASSTGSAVGSTTLVLVQRAWHDVGIDAEVKLYVTSRYFASYGESGIIQRDLFDVAFYRWVAGTDPDDETLFGCAEVPPAGQNVFHFCDAGADAAQRVALGSFDRTVRTRAYGTIQRALDAQVPFVPMWFDRRIDAHNDDLKGYRTGHAVTTFTAPYDWQI